MLVNLLCESLHSSDLQILEVIVSYIAGYFLWSLLAALLDQRLAVYAMGAHCQDPGRHAELTVYCDHPFCVVDWLGHFQHEHCHLNLVPGLEFGGEGTSVTVLWAFFVLLNLGTQLNMRLVILHTKDVINHYGHGDTTAYLCITRDSQLLQVCVLVLYWDPR